MIRLTNKEGQTIYLPAHRIESIRAVSASQSERQCRWDYNCHVLCIQDTTGYLVRESAEQVAAMVDEAMGVEVEDPASEAVRTSWPFTIRDPGTYRFARSEDRNLILEKL